mmetsp:Transcript_26811/g.80028  ORF Transcript_26811/g.80028 Transcript_26811/m.80028 type:complete len:278 (-) Transcript_26811:235-1068(-)
MPMPAVCHGVPAPEALTGAPQVCTAGDVKNMNMNKEVATRLFRMLAVNETTVNSVKRDAASYARLSLLTQQMGLVQQQAQRVVEKAEGRLAKQAKLDGDITMVTSTALSSEYDEGAKQLLSMITTNDKAAALVARDPPACARLSVLAEQVGLLQEQAQACIDEADLNRHLTELGACMPGTRLVPGTMYYHYTQNGKEVLSRIAHDEWANYDEYHGKFLYDFDYTFRRQIGTPSGIEVITQALLPQLTDKRAAASGDEVHVPNVPETPAVVCPVLSRW